MNKNSNGFSRLVALTLTMIAISLVISGCFRSAGAATPTAEPGLSFPTFEPTFTPNPIAADGTPLPTNAPELAQPPQLVGTNTLDASLAPSATPTSTAVPTTAVPPTVVPPTAVPPTAILPTPIPGPVPIRINFAKGATAGIVQGTVNAGSFLNYIIGAGKNQPLIISLDNPNNGVSFSVTGLGDGVIYVGAGQKLTSWQTMLTVTQDYLVRVSAGASKQNFTLNIRTPARITFDPGAISANRNGTTPGGLNVAYILRANANQKMDINLATTSGAAVLSVYGFQDGQPYLRYVVEQTSFSMILPVTQDYIIEIVPMAGSVATYSINIAIQ